MYACLQRDPLPYRINSSIRAKMFSEKAEVLEFLLTTDYRVVVLCFSQFVVWDLFLKVCN